MTDHIIKAAKEARIGVMDKRLGFVVFNDVSSKHLARFYAIAYLAGMERAAEMFAGQPHVEHFGREIADAIRAEAHAQNQPKNVHDGSDVSKN